MRPARKLIQKGIHPLPQHLPIVRQPMHIQLVLPQPPHNFSIGFSHGA